MKNYKVSGRTYPARNVLKDAGFTYESARKEWFGNEESLQELKRITTASYSRANQKAISGIEITEF